MQNVLVFVCDALRADTNAFDWLHKGSVVYQNAWATGGATIPSFFSIWTGLLPEEHGAVKFQSFPSAPGLDQLAREAGYNTLVVTENPWTRGIGACVDASQDRLRGAGFDYILENLPPEPWFVFYHNMGVHAPYLGMPESPDMLRNQHHRQPDTDRLRAAYDASVKDVSGRLRRFLKEIPECVTLFTSDHGEAFGEHGFHGHISDRHFTELMHVPLVVHDGKRKYTVKDPVSIVETHRILESLMKGQRARPTSVFCRGHADNYEYPVWSVRHHDWVVVYGEAIPDMWFDLENDPGMLTVLSEEDVPAEVSAKVWPQMWRPLSQGTAYTMEDEQQVEDRLRSLGYV